MRFTTKTEYGLVCLVYMARHPEADLVTINKMVAGEEMSETYLEKIFLSLREGHIVAAHPGRNGGYSLARPPQEITLREIIEALEGQTFEVFCEPEVRKDIVCTHFPACSVMPVWMKTKELLDDFYGSITLDMLAKDQLEVRNFLGAHRFKAAAPPVPVPSSRIHSGDIPSKGPIAAEGNS